METGKSLIIMTLTVLRIKIRREFKAVQTLTEHGRAAVIQSTSQFVGVVLSVPATAVVQAMFSSFTYFNAD